MRPAVPSTGQCVLCRFRLSTCSAIPKTAWRRPSPARPLRQSTDPTNPGILHALGTRYKSTVSFAPRVTRFKTAPITGRHQAAGRKPTRLRKRRDEDISSLLPARLSIMQSQCDDPRFMAQTGLQKETARANFKRFESNIRQELIDSQKSSRLLPSIAAAEMAYKQAGTGGLDRHLKYALQGFLAERSFSEQDRASHKRLSDLRYPYEWYPRTRAVQRKLHIHVGPTNSGKTYHALQRLEAAESGTYAGPLRLLAFEVYNRLNAKGRPCHLVTGDEVRFTEASSNSQHVMYSCTVEMVDLAYIQDVAVIDEIQMIGDHSRGWAWTEALMGLKAKEIHMCGEERALPLIREIAAALGEELTVHRYERLSPLQADTASLKGNLKNLRKGDCVVSFSRRGIHALKNEIEKMTKKSVAVVYGALPPEVRAQQARLFNDPDNDYDILVASDAIGMGLNLSIRRIVFESTFKYNGLSYGPLDVSDIKQIAGRAGRYRTAAQASAPDTKKSGSDTAQERPAQPPLGLVTSLEDIDFPVVQKAMKRNPVPIKSAGLLPPDALVLRFSSYFPPETPMSYILRRLHAISRMHFRFHLCDVNERVAVADVIQEVQGLETADRLKFCAAPFDARDAELQKVIVALAKCVATQSGGDLLNIPEINLEVLDYTGRINAAYLRQLETTHKAIVLYTWLSYRFSNALTSQAMAFHVKELLQDKIDEVLAQAEISRQAVKKLREKREALLRTQLEESLTADNDDTRGMFPEVADRTKDELGEEPISEVPSSQLQSGDEEGFNERAAVSHPQVIDESSPAKGSFANETNTTRLAPAAGLQSPLPNPESGGAFHTP